MKKVVVILALIGSCVAFSSCGQMGSSADVKVPDDAPTSSKSGKKK